MTNKEIAAAISRLGFLNQGSPYCYGRDSIFPTHRGDAEGMIHELCHSMVLRWCPAHVFDNQKNRHHPYYWLSEQLALQGEHNPLRSDLQEVQVLAIERLVGKAFGLTYNQRVLANFAQGQMRTERWSTPREIVKKMARLEKRQVIQKAAAVIVSVIRQAATLPDMKEEND